jgi:centrosomal protein CEP19
MSSEISPKRFGLKYDPPTIILEYRVPAKNKLYLHIMPMPELESSHDPYDWLDILRKEHKPFLDPKLIEEKQILNLIEKLQENLTEGSHEDSQEEEEDDDEDDWAF